jgi:hypothetical protein
MNVWIAIAVLGVIFAVFGMIVFIKKYPQHRQISNSSLLIGIFIPILIALSYAETLTTEFFPGLTLLDLGVFYLIGMISGFFVGVYFLQRKTLPTANFHDS